MATYIPTIGLEIHTELKTRTKMFCACTNNPDAENPNTNVCPICLGHPGALPTINQQAIESVLKLGLALGGTIARDSHFDRKSYFYPDLPKGYQISQYDRPLVEGGVLEGVRIRRIHLEEDTGKLVHPGESQSGVDFNRAGVPLMELVTEPDITNAAHAVRFAKELQRILRYLSISDADMEKGHMRVEVNISVAQEGVSEYGIKVEVKNINSFRAVEGAVEYEIKRQGEAYESGEAVSQETRGWNDAERITESQRTKESAHDYRYFPEPDLPPLDLSKFDSDALRRSLPELPEQKRTRFMSVRGLTQALADTLVDDKRLADFFEAASSELQEKTKTPRFDLLANYMTSDLVGCMNDQRKTWDTLKTTPEHLTHLIALISDGTLSSRLAKDLLAKMVETGEDPETLMKESGARLISSGDELKEIIGTIIKENPRAIEDYHKGKGNVLQFLIGQTMARTKGQAAPDVLRKLFEEVLR